MLILILRHSNFYLQKNFISLTNLVKLDLSKNQLKELPDNFGELSKLKHLDLYKNELEHLPLSFSKLQALKWLDLKDNPLMPKIAQIAGPCLDAKQCQICAQNIVFFYTKLQETVQQEKEMREKQRQKSLMENEANAQKQKQQEKKAKKKQKQQAAVERKTDYKSQNGGVPGKIGRKGKQTQEPQVKKNSFLRWFCCFVTFFMFTSVALSVALFIATSLNSPYTKFVEEYVAYYWKTFVGSLSAKSQTIAVQVENHFKHAHNVTGHEIDRLLGKFFKK